MFWLKAHDNWGRDTVVKCSFVFCSHEGTQEKISVVSSHKGKAIHLEVGAPPIFHEHATDKVVNSTHWPPLLQGNIPGTHFCYRLCRAPAA